MHQITANFHSILNAVKIVLDTRKEGKIPFFMCTMIPICLSSLSLRHSFEKQMTNFKCPLQGPQGKFLQMNSLNTKNEPYHINCVKN